MRSLAPIVDHGPSPPAFATLDAALVFDSNPSSACPAPFPLKR